MWGATGSLFAPDTWCGNFNPRAPCGARRARDTEKQNAAAPFQSTRPVWGATPPAARRASCTPISIHAPRVGRDFLRDAQGSRKNLYFNPRAPCGARPFAPVLTGEGYKFQSTRPVWGATTNLPALVDLASISIHAPRVGRDIRHSSPPARRIYFNPRAPCGARPHGTPFHLSVSYFNPRAPCGARPQQLHFQG